MVCKLGHGRMAAMVRIFSIGSFPEITPEEANYEKIAVQMIHRDFRDADEANLLEEEDMHVFDSRPLKDPLNLVRCNTCRKPVKASQYASHAERCVPINAGDGISLEFNGGSKHKKPQKRGKEKVQDANTQSSTRTKEKPVSKEATITTRIHSNLENPRSSGMTSLASREPNFSDVPAPLATKMYYLQRNHKLRLALGHLYHKATAKDGSFDSFEDDASAKKKKEIYPCVGPWPESCPTTPEVLPSPSVDDLRGYMHQKPCLPMDDTADGSLRTIYLPTTLHPYSGTTLEATKAPGSVSVL